MHGQETFKLSWETYTNHLKSMLQDMMSETELTDVTLVSDDLKEVRAHKVVLSASSPVFKSMIQKFPSNSMIYLRGIKNQELQAILEFLYTGQSNLEKDRINEFLKVASDLQITGLQQSQTVEKPTRLEENKDINMDNDSSLEDVKEEYEKSDTFREYEQILNLEPEYTGFDEYSGFTAEDNETMNDSEQKANWVEGKINKNGKPSRLLEKDGFFYRQHDVKNNKMYLRCSKNQQKKKENSCKATAIVDIKHDLIFAIAYKEDHNHEPNSLAQFVKTLEEDEIKKGLENVSLTADKLYKSLQENILESEAGEKGLSYLKTLNSFYKTLYRKRIQMGLIERKPKEKRKMKVY